MKLAVLVVPVLAAAAPSPSLGPRQAQSLCEQWGAWTGNNYTCYNNLWGKDQATSGSQCTYVDGASEAGVQWHTTWTWQGGQNNVKSYANCGKQPPKGKLVSAVSGLPTTVSWAYSSSSVRANVAYDVFTAADPDHATYSGDYEVMIWLAKYGGVGPIGSSTGRVDVAGRSWDLHIGNNGQMKVFSFVAPSPVTSFSADVKLFFNYLQSRQNFPVKTQNLLGESTKMCPPAPDREIAEVADHLRPASLPVRH